MFFYILLLFIIVLNSFIFFKGTNNKNKKIYLIWMFLPVFIISAFRGPFIGNDTHSYLNLFNSVSHQDFLYFTKANIYYEKGFIFLNTIISSITDSSQAILIVTSFITIGLIFLFIYRHSANVWLSVYLFITLMFYYNSMNVLRQYLAMAIVLSSLGFVVKRKLVPFLILVILASFIHTSAIFFIIVYIFPKLKVSYKSLVTISLCSVAFFYFLFPLIDLITGRFIQYQVYISRYFGSNNLGNILKTGVYFLIFLTGILFAYNNMSNSREPMTSKVNSIRKNNDFIEIHSRRLYTFTLLTAVILSLLSIRMSILERLADYFTIVSIVYLPNVIQNINNKRVAMRVTIAVVLISLIYNIVILTLRPEWYQVTPYSFFFQ
ncbi:EpsG family protein [Priestia filamentosa]|uniref:EpsG family protein n=1 Tax=Priestia filamentosa TaxID=1402861 RepID=UPI00031C31B3|nr:EpsG family protein [Priestia filamentosa]